MTLRLALPFLLVGLLAGTFSRLTAAPGDLDPSFETGSLINRSASVVVPAGGGKVYIGGEFTSVQGIRRNHIARLNSDGSLDTSFDPGAGAGSTVLCMAVQPDGKVLIGGTFEAYNGVESRHVARLNSDGSLDTTFNAGVGPDGGVFCLAVQADGKVVIGGWFTSFNDTACGNIARLNSDGSLDTSFNPGPGADMGVLAMAVQADGKMVIGGYFTSYNGTARPCIARLNANGSLDASFNPGSASSLYVYSLAIQSDGKVVIGGYFSNYGGTARNNIARLNSNGTLDTTFNPGSGANTAVLSVALQTDGKVLLGGYFTSVSGTARNYVARLNANGSLDATFNVGSGANSAVTSVAVESNGSVVIAGVFTAYNGTTRGRVARLGTDGSLDVSFNPGDSGLSDAVYALAVQPNGQVLIGGAFDSCHGVLRENIARLNSNGSLDSSFDPGTGANYEVHTLALRADGKVLIGGSFTTYNGTARGRVARLNSGGSLDTSFNPGTGTDNSVSCIAVQADDKVLIGGGFVTYNGIACNHIARLNDDGSLDASFNPGSGADNSVLSFSLQPDGKVLIGGSFTSYNGTARKAIARLNSDGSLDASFNPGSGINFNYVGAIAVQPDGKVLIGGDISTFNGAWRGTVARLNSDGSLDTTFATASTGFGADGPVFSMALQADGKVLISGDFNSVHGTPRGRLARLNSDGSLDATFDSASGSNQLIRSLSLQPDGKAVIGGDFFNYSSTARGYLARVANDAAAQSLTVSSTSRVEWLRSGAAPEVEQVLFESSADGVAWTSLGAGTHISGGWELTGLSLPSAFHLRARGRIGGGKDSSVAEQVMSQGVPSDIRVFAGADSGAPELTDGQAAAVDFASTPLGTPVTRSFTVKSEGATLELTALTPPPGYALVSAFTSLTLAPGATHTFQVRFLANTVAGVSAGTFSIASNDPDEPSFDFPLTATAFNGVNKATLDTTLAGTGFLSTAFPQGGGFAQGVAVQSDGKIVVVGYASNGTNLDFALARYLPDGRLDPTFGTGGLVLMDIDGADDWGRAVAIQSDGRIVVAGTCYNGTNDDFAIARFMPDGSPDNSFDGNAKKRTPIGTSNDRAWSVAIQSDGKIVLAGEAYYSPYWRFAAVRYTTAGAHDTTFSSDGLATANVGSDDANGRGVGIQSDGKIVVGGHYLTTSNSQDFAAVRFTTAGALDTTFSGDGKALATIGTGVDRSYSLCIQTDGKILLAGESHNGTNLDFAVARFTTAGALDATFSDDGRLTTPFGAGDDRARAMRVMPDGSIVVAGYAAVPGGNQCAFARYTAAGEPDPDFGTGGIATHGLLNGVSSRVYALALDADNNLIAAGDRDDGTTSEFFLARLGGKLNPTVITTAASALSTTAATLNGVVSPNGVITQAWFEYGLTPALGTTTPAQSVGDGASGLPVSALLNGLSQGVTYHYRLVAQNGETTVVATTQTFTTVDPEIRLFNGGNETAPELADGQTSPVDFGTTPLGTPVTRPFTLRNEGSGSLVISSVNVPAVYELLPLSLPLTLAPGTNQTFYVRFLSNTVKAPFTGTLAVMSDDLNEGTFEVPLSARAVTSQPHIMDTSFSGDGMQTTIAGTSGNGKDVAVQADGRIVVLGYARNNSAEDILVIRYLPNGDLDDSFGTGGVVITDFSASDHGEAVALQPDGKIVIGGGNGYNSSSDFVLARYLADGQLDTTFGTGGKVVTNIAAGYLDWIEDLVIQPDGKIVAVGTAESASTGPNVAVARYTVSGALDTSFSGDGKLTTDIGGSNDYGNAVALQSDGRLVVAAYSNTGANGYRLAALRYLADGSLDTSFSGDGKIVLTLGGETYAYATAVVVQPDGRIVLGGYATISSVSHFALLRLTTAGVLDTTFGTGGKTTNSFEASSRLAELALLSDGHIIAGGDSQPAGQNPRFALARYSGDGVLDTGFGSNGLAFPFLPGGWCTSMALQADEKVILAGWTVSADVLVARFGTDLRPSVGTSAASAITTGAATLNGTVNPNGVITQRWFEYGTTTAYGGTTPPQAAGYGTTAKTVTAPISSLASGTTYHYRIVAQNGETIVRGSNQTFTTQATPQQMFEAAMTTAGLTGPNAEINATPRGDGVPNLVKYAFNMNLQGPDAATMPAGGSAGLPAITTPAPSGTAGIFRYEFLRRKNSGLIYTPQKTSSLTLPSAWQPLNDAPTIIPIDTTWERVIYEEPYDPAQTTKLFGRVQLTLPP